MDAVKDREYEAGEVGVKDRDEERVLSLEIYHMYCIYIQW